MTEDCPGKVCAEDSSATSLHSYGLNKEKKNKRMTGKTRNEKETKYDEMANIIWTIELKRTRELLLSPVTAGTSAISHPPSNTFELILKTRIPSFALF